MNYAQTKVCMCFFLVSACVCLCWFVSCEWVYEIKQTYWHTQKGVCLFVCVLKRFNLCGNLRDKRDPIIIPRSPVCVVCACVVLCALQIPATAISMKPYLLARFAWLCERACMLLKPVSEYYTLECSKQPVAHRSKSPQRNLRAPTYAIYEFAVWSILTRTHHSASSAF